MADSYTTNLLLPLMETGGQTNNWINVLNDDFFSAVEQHLYGRHVITGASGITIESGTDLLYGIIDFRPNSPVTTTKSIWIDFDNNPQITIKRSIWIYNGADEADGGEVTVEIVSGGVHGDPVSIPTGINILYLDGLVVRPLIE